MVSKTVEVLKIGLAGTPWANNNSKERKLFLVNYRVTLSDVSYTSTTYHQAHFFARDELDAYQRWERYRSNIDDEES